MQPPTLHRAVYLRQKRAASIPIYFRDEAEKHAFQVRAEAAGYANFSAWVVQTLILSGQGHAYPPGYVDALQADVSKLRGWLEQKNEELAELRKELRSVNQQREDMRVVLARLGQESPNAPSTPRRFA